jgi:DNA-binding transcriptional LysR family regulator
MISLAPTLRATRQVAQPGLVDVRRCADSHAVSVLLAAQGRGGCAAPAQLLKDDYAAELVAVLPEWIRLLAEHTYMPAELTARCLAYASGDLQFRGILDELGRSNPMARVTE